MFNKKLKAELLVAHNRLKEAKEIIKTQRIQLDQAYMLVKDKYNILSDEEFSKQYEAIDKPTTH